MRTKSVMVAVAGFAALVPNAARAAQAEVPSSGQAAGLAPGSADDPAISDIVVTAQRRSERLEDVPLAITAISPDSAETRGIRNLQDLTQAIAGVQVNFQGSFTFPTIRGVTSLTTGFGFENNVGVYIDGFYQPDSTAINADFANLESIQVLKGPQGSLYGRNATGGAILIQTLRPSDTFTGKVDLRYGSFDDKSASGFVSGPITDGIRVSLAAYGRQTDGYYDQLDAQGVKIGDKGARAHTISTRGKIEVDLAESLVGTLGFNFIEFRDDRGGVFSPELNRGASIPPKVGRLYDRRTTSINRPNHFLFRTREPTFKLEWDTGIGTLTSNTGYARRTANNAYDFDGSYADLTYLPTIVKERTFQQGLDFNITAIDGLDLVVGGSYYDDHTKINLDTLSNGRLGLRSDTRYTTEAIAGFVDGTYHLSSKFSLGFGGRYTTEERSTALISMPFSAVTGNPTATLTGGGKVRINNFSPRGVLTYQVADRSNIYASISRGFRTGFIQAIAIGTVVQPFNIKPEKITAYELGFKTARRGLRFDAAAFYYDYSNIQVSLSQTNPLCAGQPGCGPISILANAPKAEIYGLESQLDWEPVERLKLNLSGSYLHGRYTDFPNVTSIGLNAATDRNVTNQVQDWTGKQMARAPKFSATLAADYTIPGVFGGQLGIAGNFKYTTSYVPNAPALFGPLGPAGRQDEQRYRQDGYATANASINWTDPSETFLLGVFVNNLTNVDYRLSFNGSANGSYGIWNQPRQWGVRAGAKW